MYQGGKNYEFLWEKIHFFDNLNAQHNKVLNNQSKLFLPDLLSEQYHAKELSDCQPRIHFPFVLNSLFIEHLKLSCDIHSFLL